MGYLLLHARPQGLASTTVHAHTPAELGNHTETGLSPPQGKVGGALPAPLRRLKHYKDVFLYMTTPTRGYK